jgi:hypothetical protein
MLLSQYGAAASFKRQATNLKQKAALLFLAACSLPLAA